MVGVNWALNLSGIPLSEKKMKTIPYPYTELYVHITTKTVQMGSFLGCFGVAPVIAGAKGQFNEDGVKKWMETCGKYGVLLGLVTGPLMTSQFLKAVKATEDSVWDRCYRIRYNVGQCRVDRLTLVGAVAGCAAATYMGDSGTLGALVGMNTGMVLAAVMNSLLEL